MLAVALLLALSGIFPISLVVQQSIMEGDRALASGDAPAALAAYQAAAAAMPWNALPLERAVQIEMTAGRYARAEEGLRRIAALSGWTPDLHRRLGEVFHARGETALAVAEWEAALEHAPDDGDALRALAEAHLQARDYEQAAAALGRLVEAAPQEMWAHYRLGLLVASYDAEAAAHHLTAAAADPTFGAAAEAVVETLDALSGEADRAYASAQLALTLMQLEEWAAAEQALSVALLFSPRYAEAMAYLGLVQDRLGDDGLPALLQAVALEPENPLVRHALGRHYAEVGDYDAAIPALIQAAALRPDNPVALAELGAAYSARGDLADAAQWFHRAAELDRDNPFFWEQLAAFYADTGYNLEEEGLAAINSALLNAPDNADILASFGWARNQMGDQAGAMRALEQALEIDSAHPRALYYYGVLLEITGDTVGAVDVYLNVVRVAPGTRFGALAERGLSRLGANP